MNHAAEGTLLAFLDGETTSEAAAEIEGHMAGCEACRAELERLRAESQLVASALQLLDREPAAAATSQAWWSVRAAARQPAGRAAGRFALGSLARAAAILLVFAGALAALAGSPVRELLGRLLGPDDAPPARTAPEPAPAPPRPAAAEPARAELPGVVLVPTDGRVRVLVWSVQPGAIIRVNLVEGNRVSVEAGSDAEDVRFRSGSGRIEVMSLGSAEAVIQIPRSLPLASLDVDGRQWLFKDGDQLRLNGPVVEQSRDLVVFRAN
jgi:pyruvate/2-oxoglutarate dehydrogenase complex dihydrolipoamide acyltransferase (E2) component